MSIPQSYDERYISQQPAIEVLQGLGYQYIQAEQAEAMRENLYSVLLKTVLETKLKELNSYQYRDVTYKFSEANIQTSDARFWMSHSQNGLVKANESIYETLMLGRTYTELLPDGSKKSFDDSVY
ncbi:MAG: hypothetical protein LRY71_02370 [Bacillaceae bacterium]|nr:hypothetical protein [Bacillaceae bacterium]